MTADELLNAHVLRLRNDPGYAAIWQDPDVRFLETLDAAKAA